MTSRVRKTLATIIAAAFFLFRSFICSTSTSASEMYRNVPAEMLMKKAITKLPWSIIKVPTTSPATLMSACTTTIRLVTLELQFYFLQISPRVSPSAHLWTTMALASPKTPIGVLWSPTARHSKKAWMDMPAWRMKGLRLISFSQISSLDLFSEPISFISILTTSLLDLRGSLAKLTSYSWSCEWPIRILSMYMIMRKVNIAMIMVRGRLLLL